MNNFIFGLRLMKFAVGTAKVRKASMKEEKRFCVRDYSNDDNLKYFLFKNILK